MTCKTGQGAGGRDGSRRRYCTSRISYQERQQKIDSGVRTRDTHVGQHSAGAPSSSSNFSFLHYSQKDTPPRLSESCGTAQDTVGRVTNPESALPDTVPCNFRTRQHRSTPTILVDLLPLRLCARVHRQTCLRWAIRTEKDVLLETQSGLRGTRHMFVYTR